MTEYTFKPIGRIASCFTQKFGIPRQPGLVPEARADLDVLPPYHRYEAFKGLEAFSHIWIIFVFHGLHVGRWKTTVRPPRLGGNQRLGVFATRSGFRPNPIGQSVVQLVGLQKSKDALRLHLKGADLLDGTPVLDIKPYLPYADSIPKARAGFADTPPDARFQVSFTPAADRTCRRLESEAYPDLCRLIRSVLCRDPRPAYLDGATQRRFGLRLWDLDIQFKVEAGQMVVETIEPG